MPKDEWGVKRACPECSVRFYDLQNDPMTCPSCGAEFDIASLTQSKSRAAEKAKAKPVEKAAPPPVEDDDDDLVIDDESETSSDTNVSDDLLDDDDDDSTDLNTIADVSKEDDD